MQYIQYVCPLQNLIKFSKLLFFCLLLSFAFAHNGGLLYYCHRIPYHTIPCINGTCQKNATEDGHISTKMVRVVNTTLKNKTEQLSDYYRFFFILSLTISGCIYFGKQIIFHYTLNVIIHLYSTVIFYLLL